MAAVDDKTKQLIRARQSQHKSPASIASIAHTLAAKHAGATEAQIKEAIGAAALVREMEHHVERQPV